jgi:hypothetical protein
MDLVVREGIIPRHHEAGKDIGYRGHYCHVPFSSRLVTSKEN